MHIFLEYKHNTFCLPSILTSNLFNQGLTYGMSICTRHCEEWVDYTPLLILRLNVVRREERDT